MNSCHPCGPSSHGISRSDYRSRALHAVGKGEQNHRDAARSRTTNFSPAGLAGLVDIHFESADPPGREVVDHCSQRRSDSAENPV